MTVYCMEQTTILTHGGHSPVMGNQVFLASGARVIGQVKLGEATSVWFNTTIRGDVHWIEVGSRTNIQDQSMIHVTTNQAPTKIGSDVTIGHSVTLHGCTIGNRCLIGMGAIIMDDVIIGDDSLIAAGSLIPPGKEFPARSLILGNPGKRIREVTDEEVAKFRDSAAHYCKIAESYREHCQLYDIG